MRLANFLSAIGILAVLACADVNVADPLISPASLPSVRATQPLDDVVITGQAPYNGEWDWYFFMLARSGRGESSDYYNDYLGGGSDGTSSPTSCPRGGIPQTGCELQLPMSTEMDGFKAEADRLQASDDSVCLALGSAIRSGLLNIRMHANSYYYDDPSTGSRGLISGQYWEAGDSLPQEIHIARNFDPLNPRTQSELNETLRHEFAHALGYKDPWHVGATFPYAADIAKQCAPSTS